MSSGSNTVGIIGMGMLGSAVASRLADCRADLIVYNRTARKSDPFRGRAEIASTPKDVAKSADIIITVLRDADAVNDVIFGSEGVIRAGRRVTIADMSTINPIDSKKITDKLAGMSVTKLDIPVMGGPDVAVTGELVMMCSGEQAAFEEYRGLFEMIAKKVFYLGDSSTAHLVKLAMNLQITMHALALSEGITMVDAAGVDPKLFLEVLNSTYFKTGMSQKKAYKMVDGVPDATFTLANLKKDIGMMTDTARELGVSLPMMERAGKIYGDAARGGLGDIDYTGIIRYIRDINSKD